MTRPARWRTALPAMLLVVLLAMAALGGADATDSTNRRLANPAAELGGEQAFVGTDICVVCHIDYARLWLSLEHSQAMLAEEHPPALTGCEACHGPGGLHVAGLREVIVAWSELEPTEGARLCLQCHDQLEPELWFQSIHSELMGCSVCHEVHYPVEREALLKMPEGEECSDCHDMAAAEAAGHHHPLLEGGLPCNMCHQFHGAEHPALLYAPMEQTCTDCHDEVPQPPSHAEPEFRLNHGDEARADQERCLTCHSYETSCASCHAVEFPHPEDFVVEHGAAAREHLNACHNCHGQDYCLQCHDTASGLAAADAGAGAQDGEA